MANLVLDASLASTWCFPDEQTTYTNSVLRLISSSIKAFAPRLWAYEIRNSVLMGVRRGRIIEDHADEFLRSLADLNIQLTDPVSYNAVFAGHSPSPVLLQPSSLPHQFALHRPLWPSRSRGHF
jgi:predicted nucleic acid-binding protein